MPAFVSAANTTLTLDRERILFFFIAVVVRSYDIAIRSAAFPAAGTWRTSEYLLIAK
jgi:hypothetical protein